MIDTIEKQKSQIKDPKKSAFLSAAKASLENAEEIPDEKKKPEIIKKEENKKKSFNASKKIKSIVNKAINNT